MPDQVHGADLSLAPHSHPAVMLFKEALAVDGIPVTSFTVNDVQKEVQRFEAVSVRFTQKPRSLWVPSSGP